MNNIHTNNRMAEIAVPGHFNDPDMLQVGNPGLNPVEARSHFSLWAIAGAPLLAGNDIIHADNETLAILTAKEVLEVNQDLGINGAIQGRIVVPSSGVATGDDDDLTVSMKTCSTTAPEQQFSVGTGASHIVNERTNTVITDPGCQRAPLKNPFRGPNVVARDASSATTRSTCSGQDLEWTLQANKTITSGVDGSCLNVVEGESVVQMFSCARQGSETNGQWTFDKATGHIVSVMHNTCLEVSPAPSPTEVWAKNMSDGKRVAVVLLNLDDSGSHNVTLDFATIGLPKGTKAVIRDLWAEADVGTFVDSYTSNSIPAHGVAMLTVAH